ncbi:SgcJ/EcaC family oxidoreductase [Allorhodopirellula solitaria]|uniref:YCII-related domain protein n=1 Tax=Allorhodopirellula solitaria TaxID=2527987 RepID=A0A5C5YJQ9_9BACT|nr:SgcJ/EcaC family oxidoreductase [Allorhodopirellula solitaria]TWT75125.1 YCII-related domain protein [Allorhodopirellula solitaria]
MRVMVMIKASPSSEAGQMPSEQLLTEMGNFNESLVKAGIMRGGEGLKPSGEGVRVHFSGSNRTVIDGPFAETKEIIAGYWMWEVDSMDQAIEWVRRCPNPMAEDSDIEIRPVFEAEDFGDEFTPELQEQEDAVRELAGDRDEAEIRRLIARWSRALEAKDVDGLTGDYAPDAVLYDAIPPYKAEGVDSIRKSWECCMPYLPEVQSVHRDLKFHIAGDMAMVHGLHNFQTEGDHPCSQSWIRVTLCYRRIDGKWKVIHEHVSVPFNPVDNQAWEIKDPDSLESPDYDQPANK